MFHKKQKNKFEKLRVNENIPPYIRHANIVMPTQNDNKIKPHEIFEGIPPTSKKKTSLKKNKKVKSKK